MFRGSLPARNHMPPGTTYSSSVHPQGAPPPYQERPITPRVVGHFPHTPSMGHIPTTTSTYASPGVDQPLFGPLGVHPVPRQRTVPQPNLSGYSPYTGYSPPFFNGILGQTQRVYPFGYPPVAPDDAWRRPMYADRGDVEIESFLRVAGAIIKGAFCAATWPLRSGWALLTRGEFASFWR